MAVLRLRPPSLNERRPLESLPGEYLECRDLGHAWTHDTDGVPVQDHGIVTFTRQMLCPRCATTRTETLHVFRDGSVMKAHQKYTYPAGYMLVKGQGRRANVWAEYARRTGVLAG